MALSEAQLDAVVRRSGEAHKATADRMVSDETIQAIADEVGLIVDADGLAPSDAGYTTTYDLNAIAAEVWREKAGVVAQGFDFRAEGGEFTRSQYYRHCLQMATKRHSMSANLSV